ncbi:MAG TPA: dihydrofolate reductase family protein [Acidimicrobiales bacterium]|nr:dihydrofolate reductase family protein [Acidimicrobiales bacterium]
MRKVTYSMGMSLDGYIVGPDGGFQWTGPSQELFRSSIDEVRQVGIHLLGRRIYEAMRYWETVDPATLDEDQLEWRSLWNALPKLVFSRSLTEVEGNHDLATGTLAEELDRLRHDDAPGDIAIAGADLAAQVAGLGLIDEYYIRTFPVLVGGGRPMFAQDERQVDLELLSTRSFDNGVVGLRYRVRR